MFAHRPVWVSVTVPQALLDYLHDLNIDVLGFLRQECSYFWYHCMDYYTPPQQLCFWGATVVQLAPCLRVFCSVATAELQPGEENTALVVSDFAEYLQLSLRQKLRCRGVEPDLSRVNLLQVSQEAELLQ